jgi:GNAT superfamily N-acetyltransferase
VPNPPPEALEAELRDGTPVLIRPIVPADKERLRRGFRRLSSQSRYRRFGAYISDLTPEQLRFLTEIDYENHIAWIAVDPASPELPALGVARCVRIEDEPDVAEAAIVVADPVQGRGLGSLLLGMLAVAARSNGIRQFRAYVMSENRPMLDMLQELGGTVELEGPGLCRVDTPIAEDPEELPDTPTGRVFKAVAKKVLPGPAVLRRSVLSRSERPL